MARIPLALQLYSVRTDTSKDLAGTIRAVAEMGYEGVEFAGFFNHSAAEVRAMVEDNGLQVAGAHIGIDTLLGDEFEKTVEFHQALGNKFLIVPGLSAERRASRASWLETARQMNEIAEKLAPLGLSPGYHCHYEDFHKLAGDDEYPWDIFFSNTRHEVIMQFDTGNALHAGADAPPFIERYPSRAVTVHLKEESASNPDAVIGEGDVPWQQIFDLCESIGGTQWYIVEQETYPVPPLEAARLCLENLKGMGK